VPKVHNKSIKRQRKGFKQESKRQPERHPGLAHRTVRCTSALEAELFTFGNFQGRSAIIHRTVRWVTGQCPVCQRSNGYYGANGHLQRHLMRARARRSQARARRRTGQSTVPVRCTTGQPDDPTSQSTNGRNPTARWRGWHTGQCPVAHWTVRCARRQQPPPTVKFGGWGYKYPNHPHIQVIQVFHLPTTYKSSSIQL
jgi:hypothetical protein